MSPPDSLVVRAVGWLWWSLLPIRKRLAVEAYRACFPERDPAELRRSVGEMVEGYLDLVRGERCEFEGLEELEGPGLVLCGHFGAWDLTLISAGRVRPMTAFVKAPSNALAAWWIERQRRRGGVQLLPPRNSIRAAYRALEEGRFIAFIQDQRHNAGIEVPFFGRPARTSEAFAAMAWRTRAPLYGVWQWREGGRYRARVERLGWEIPDDREQAIHELTARSQAWYEEKIRIRPHSWLWLHDRWKLPGPRARQRGPSR